MRHIFSILLITSCLFADSANATTIWQEKERGLKVYILTCSGTEYQEAKKYMYRWDWQNADLEEADYVFALFRSDDTSPLKKHYDNVKELLTRQAARKVTLGGEYYHLYLYKLHKDSPAVDEYYHDYIAAPTFLNHNYKY